MNDLDITKQELEQALMKITELELQLSLSDKEREQELFKQKVSMVYDKSIFRMQNNRQAIQTVIDECQLDFKVSDIIINSDKKTGLFDRDSIITSIVQLASK